MRPIPEMAVNFVAHHEGYSAKAYPDPATGGEPFTIGYGRAHGVKPTDRCTKAQALGWLAEDMQIAVSKLYGVLKPDIIDSLNDHQWSALLSFCYNVGAGDWTIWKLLNARKFDQAADQLTRFVNAAGQKMQGLVNRRADEFVLFHQGDAEGENLPSAFTRGVGITPPTPETQKPIWMSKTFWTGGGISAAASIQGIAQNVQGMAAPQAYHSPWIAKVVAITAVLIVGAGMAIMVFKMLEQRARTHQ